MASQAKEIRELGQQLRAKASKEAGADSTDQALQLIAIGIGETAMLLFDRIATALEDQNANARAKR